MNQSQISLQITGRCTKGDARPRVRGQQVGIARNDRVCLGGQGQGEKQVVVRITAGAGCLFNVFGLNITSAGVRAHHVQQFPARCPRGVALELREQEYGLQLLQSEFAGDERITPPRQFERAARY